MIAVVSSSESWYGVCDRGSAGLPNGVELSKRRVIRLSSATSLPIARRSVAVRPPSRR